MIAAARDAFPGAPLLETAGAGDEARLAREALSAGATTIVAIGGDGTWSNVAGAIVAQGVECRLALLAGGTGNDFAKNVCAPATDPRATARLVAGRAERRIDVGFVDDRCFINCAGFGFDAAVIAVARQRRWPGGPLHYLVHALEQLVGFRGIEIGEDRSPFAPHLLLVVANGARFGGSFHIAPGADLGDGMLDVLGVADVATFARARVLAAATRGTHVGLPGVSARRMAGIRLRFRAPPIYEADGELCVAASVDVTIRCAPGALRVVTSSADRE